MTHSQAPARQDCSAVPQLGSQSGEDDIRKPKGPLRGKRARAVVLQTRGIAKLDALHLFNAPAPTGKGRLALYSAPKRE